MSDEMYRELAGSIDSLEESVSVLRRTVDNLNSKLALVALIMSAMIFNVSIIAMLLVR